MKRRKFVLASVYDTETTNMGTGDTARAFPVLFIDNDIRGVELVNYKQGDGTIRFYRVESEMQDRIDEYVKWGYVVGKVPIICAYNLMFDLKPLMEELDKRYDIQVNAQSSTNVYTVDLYEPETDNMVLRFWDTFHLEMRGLAAMGETCGLEKAVGDWDYTLIRSQETPLTEEELFYAGRDTEVIPAYLSYLLRANEWMKQDDLGNRVLTKTSIVRQMARREIGNIFVAKQDGKRLSLDKAFSTLCMAQLPRSYDIYALRKACFRGGFTFTAAATASQVTHNVASLDVTSMHHTFINGRRIPLDFVIGNKDELELVVHSILTTSREHVIENYDKPFNYAIHARMRFVNLRLRHGSCFEKWGIALESTSKFKREVPLGSDVGEDPRSVAQENAVRANGWHDSYDSAVLAFGKVYGGHIVTLHLNELELWALSRVYEWDSYEIVFGEWSSKFRIPPDFVTLQSNKLFDMKSAAKFISKHYIKGKPYPYNLAGIPDGIAESLKNGTCEPQFFESWYTSTVKGMFNGIYGTQAQDIYKPGYKCDNGEFVVDMDTVTTPENWNERQPKSCRVLYTYGMRIVGGSRLHMVLAMELLYEELGDRVSVTGGDTDSMKVACADDVTDDELEQAMKPIAKCSRIAIWNTMQRVRKLYPEMASPLTGIGSFDIENRGEHYKDHIELWNKCRVSWDGEHSHVTCAGLPRPIGMYTIENYINDRMRECGDFYKVVNECIGYNVVIDNSISHTLEAHTPKVTDIFDSDVIDYLGNKSHVRSHESNALYAAGRWLGDTSKITNASSVEYLERRYGRTIDISMRRVGFDGRKAYHECF